MAGNLTMAQMAMELSISKRVVSAVVNGNAKKLRVSEATEVRVKDYLEKRGYVQSKSALQVKKGIDQNTVGILFCGRFLHFSHLITALSYLTEQLEKKYGVIDISGVSHNMINEGVREQVAKGVKRLIWIHANVPEVEIENAKKFFPLLARIDKTVIYNYGHIQDDIEKEYLRHGIQLVGFDRSATYKCVAETFRNSGHVKVALDEILFNDNKHGLHGAAFVSGLFKQHGFDVYGICPANVHKLTDSEMAVALSENLISVHKRNGVNCAFIRNDMMGGAIINILLKRGFRIPEDIAIIGFGYLPLSEFEPVPLTTFRHPVKEMCDKTLELLARKSSSEGKRYYFQDELILRKSHGS